MTPPEIGAAADLARPPLVRLAAISVPRAYQVALVVLTLCATVGAAVAFFPPIYIAGSVASLAAVVVGRWNRGVLAAGLVLLVLNGVPFINTRPSAVSGTNANILADLAFFAVVALLLGSAFMRVRQPRQDRVAGAALLWSGAFLGWWAVKALAASPGVPAVAAISYGRDFAYFALFLPLALLGLRRRSDLIGFAVVLAGGAVLFSLGQIAAQVLHLQLSWLIHVEKVRDFEGVVRIYAPMNDLLIAAFPIAFAAMVLAKKPWQQRAIPLVVLTGFANALSFVRAVYVSELLALLLISLIWARGSGWRARRIRRTSLAMFAAVVFVGLSVAVAGSGVASNGGSSSPLQAVVARAELGLSNVQGKNGTLGYRLRQAHRELEVLGGHAVPGLGFLNPTYRYFPDLRRGSIRDSDLGSLSIVMTMGLIGLILAYIPLAAGLGYLLRRRDGFVQYGGAMYLSVALVGSITLATLSSVSGLLVLGSMLAACVNWTAATAPEPNASFRVESRRVHGARGGEWAPSRPMLNTASARSRNIGPA
jgi:hypothetical protein